LPGAARLTGALPASGIQVNERVSQELNHLVQSLGEECCGVGGKHKDRVRLPLRCTRLCEF